MPVDLSVHKLGTVWLFLKWYSSVGSAKISVLPDVLNAMPQLAVRDHTTGESNLPSFRSALPFMVVTVAEEYTGISILAPKEPYILILPVDNMLTLSFIGMPM